VCVRVHYYVYMRVDVCVCVCVCVRTNMCTYESVHANVCAYESVRANMCAYESVWVCVFLTSVGSVVFLSYISCRFPYATEQYCVCVLNKSVLWGGVFFFLVVYQPFRTCLSLFLSLRVCVCVCVLGSDLCVSGG